MKLTTNTAEGRSYLYHAITGETIAECKKDRHAQTIAHRVNCFDELVAALDSLLNESVTNRAYCYEKNPDWRRSNERVNMTSASESVARAALEKAKQ